MPMVPTPLNDSTSDMEKILSAFSGITSIGSFDDILAAFGVIDLPPAQKYGIILGVTTFTLTVTTVICLLFFGGTFKRIADQQDTGASTVPNAVEERLGRPLLLERLIEAQHRMVKKYEHEEEVAQQGDTKGKAQMTGLTEMLLNVAPDMSSKALEHLSDGKKRDSTPTSTRFIPDGYQKNYTDAYRKCQEAPGGKIISGKPEARFEAYARAYAGCGSDTSTAYRRSYARMYEAMSCQNHGSEEQYRQHWIERPGDLVGRTVRLEPLEADRHLKSFYEITCGDVHGENNAYDPNEVWCFSEEGPFANPEMMRQSFVFQRRTNREASFAIVEHVTHNIIGVVALTNDNPRHLTISLELPIVKPSSEGTVESIEACFLLIDRLFALGYRRVQLSIDSMDTTGKKLSGRLGFTQEGMIPKDRVVKESNRDSIIYGLLNSDWDKGARSFLYKKLHGEKAMKADMANEKKEDEHETQQKYLAEKKAAEVLEKANKKL